MLVHVHPSQLWFACEARPLFVTRLVPALSPGAGHGTTKCPGRLCTHRVLPGDAAASRATSVGVTPLSSLIRAHAPDQNPPAVFGSTYYGRSLQVVTSPCWELALPGVISAILVWVLGPLPRSVPFGAYARFFPKGFGLTSDLTGSARQRLAAMQLQRRLLFRGCSHSVMFMLPYLLDPQVAPTAVAQCPQGGRAVYTTQ